MYYTNQRVTDHIASPPINVTPAGFEIQTYLNTITPPEGDNSLRLATTEYTDRAIASLIDGAPELLDTLDELAASIADDPTFYDTMFRRNEEIRQEQTRTQEGSGLLTDSNPLVIASIESGSGAYNSGDYKTEETSNYLKAQDFIDSSLSANLFNADILLDSAVNNLQIELDDTQTGAGLESDGSYTPYTQYNDATATDGAHYIHAASDLRESDKLLDAALFAGTTGLQGELDATQTGAGLQTDGVYVADANSHYITNASSLKNADSLLDTELKSLSDNHTNLFDRLQYTDENGNSYTVTAELTQQLRADVDTNDDDITAQSEKTTNLISAVAIGPDENGNFIDARAAAIESLNTSVIALDGDAKPYARIWHLTNVVPVNNTTFETGETLPTGGIIDLQLKSFNGGTELDLIVDLRNYTGTTDDNGNAEYTLYSYTEGQTITAGDGATATLTSISPYIAGLTESESRSRTELKSEVDDNIAEASDLLETRVSTLDLAVNLDYRIFSIRNVTNSNFLENNVLTAGSVSGATVSDITKPYTVVTVEDSNGNAVDEKEIHLAVYVRSNPNSEHPTPKEFYNYPLGPITSSGGGSGELYRIDNYNVGIANSSSRSTTELGLTSSSALADARDDLSIAITDAANLAGQSARIIQIQPNTPTDINDSSFRQGEEIIQGSNRATIASVISDFFNDSNVRVMELLVINENTDLLNFQNGSASDTSGDSGTIISVSDHSIAGLIASQSRATTNLFNEAAGASASAVQELTTDVRAALAEGDFYKRVFSLSNVSGAASFPIGNQIRRSDTNAILGQVIAISRDTRNQSGDDVDQLDLVVDIWKNSPSDREYQAVSSSSEITSSTQPDLYTMPTSFSIGVKDGSNRTGTLTGIEQFVSGLVTSESRARTALKSQLTDLEGNIITATAVEQLISQVDNEGNAFAGWGIDLQAGGAIGGVSLTSVDGAETLKINNIVGTFNAGHKVRVIGTTSEFTVVDYFDQFESGVLSGSGASNGDVYLIVAGSSFAAGNQIEVVDTDDNGIVTTPGITANIVSVESTPPRSDFIIEADNFKIKSGTTGKTPFTVNTGENRIEMTNVTITGGLDVGGSSGGRMNLDDDKIQIFDTNSNLRVKIGKLT